MREFEQWKAALSENPRAKFISYPNLNHLFIAVEGTSTPENTLEAGHVDISVVEDIERWIKGPK
jgi:hypothetical protein